jgi:tetratricopeptide (TPR) repeat protein
VLQRNLRDALWRQDFTQAALLLDRLKDQAPLAVETRALELEFLLRQRDTGAAVELADQLLALFPSSIRVHFLAGQAAYQYKKYGLAVARFRESLALYPAALTRQWLARALCQAGEFEEAEALLVALRPSQPRVLLNLAWLYERMQRYERAVECVDNFLVVVPQDRFALSQQARLRARLLQPEHLQEEVETLVELGEEIAPEVLPQYVDALFSTGKAAQARRFIREHQTHWSARLAEHVAWVCYHAQAYDIALDLFLPNLVVQRRNVRYLSALEKCAVRCARVPEVAERYAEQATAEPALYGRKRKLERRMGPK